MLVDWLDVGDVNEVRDLDVVNVVDGSNFSWLDGRGRRDDHCFSFGVEVHRTCEGDECCD